MSEEQAKRLTVDFSYRTPEFKFEGAWSGSDIRTLVTHARRAYLRHQQALRRSEATAVEPTATK